MSAGLRLWKASEAGVLLEAEDFGCKGADLQLGEVLSSLLWILLN